MHLVSLRTDPPPYRVSNVFTAITLVGGGAYLFVKTFVKVISVDMLQFSYIRLSCAEIRSVRAKNWSADDYL